MRCTPAPGRRPGSTWWLLAKVGRARARVLIVGCGANLALPVFSGEGEARMFLRFGDAPGEAWRIMRTSAGGLVSLLRGPFAGVENVALDPLPGMTEDEMSGLVVVTRGRFQDRFLVPGRGTSCDAPR